MDIRVYNREKTTIGVEKVYGGRLIKWLYESSLGVTFSSILCKSPFSVLYGLYQRSEASRLRIDEFIRQYQIKMDEFLPDEGAPSDKPYLHFNNFFIRRFRPEARHFIDDPFHYACLL